MTREWHNFDYKAAAPSWYRCDSCLRGGVRLYREEQRALHENSFLSGIYCAYCSEIEQSTNRAHKTKLRIPTSEEPYGNQDYDRYWGLPGVIGTRIPAIPATMSGVFLTISSMRGGSYINTGISWWTQLKERREI